MSEFHILRYLYEWGATDEGKVNETILPKLTMVLLQMGLDCMFNGIFVEGPTCNYNGLGKSDFVVGLVENIFNLKTMTILL